MSHATRAHESMQQDDLKDAEALLPLFYGELRRLAAHRVSRPSGDRRARF